MSDEVLYDGTSGDPTVVWYDGGGTTGWAVISVHPDALTDPECFVSDNLTFFACGEFYGNEFMQVDQMVHLAELWPGAALGVEHWILYESSHGRKDENLTSLVRINAAFRYALHLRAIERMWADARRTGVPPLTDDEGQTLRMPAPLVFRQNAALGVHSLHEDLLKEFMYRGKDLHLLTRGSTHSRDATRHALTFLKRVKGNPKLRAEAFPALSGQSEAPSPALSGA